MGTLTVSSSTKLCSTCSLWGGPREAMRPYPAYFVRFDDCSKGLCMGGRFNYAETTCITVCGAWKKWDVLR